MIETLNFVFDTKNSNKKEVDEHLKKNGYLKIGHKKLNTKAYCVMINRKQYFEIETVCNPHITKTSNISDVYHYCV